MKLSQRLALDSIHCPPSEDKQFSFRMPRVNKKNIPARGDVIVYTTTKKLPTTNLSYHVFTLGSIPSGMLNLLDQGKSWYKDMWIKASDDMIARDYIFKVYNQDGMVYPSCFVYYSFIDENSLLIAVEVAGSIKNKVDVSDFNFVRFYSSSYFRTTEYNSLPVKTGVNYISGGVNNNTEKVAIQNFISSNKANGGDVYVYVDCHYVPTMSLNIPDGSFVEVVYDQSVLSRETYPVSGLRTFQSTLDSKPKYLVYRPKTVDYIQYEDDTEIYLTCDVDDIKKGLFFYRHEPSSVRNVTDKDYSVNSQYVNNSCIRLGEMTTPGISNKNLVMYVRKSGKAGAIIPSSLKLNELYKLPNDIQLDIINSTDYSATVFRSENLENSDYFKVVKANKMIDVTPALANSALGYNGLTRHYADTPQKVQDSSFDVPELYQWNSIAFEYNAQGKYTGKFVTNGPSYIRSTDQTTYVEFMKGSIPSNFGSLYENVGSVADTDNTDEIIILSAHFDGNTRLSTWENITNTSKVTRTTGTVSWNEDTARKIKVVRLNLLNIYDLDFDLAEGSIYFPITVEEDRGAGFQTFIADVPYLNISVYLNENYLTEGIDYLIDFPYINVFNKKYINYTLPLQKLHIRATGFTLDKTEINHLNVNGFVNNGSLTRNNYYDIRDDRVYSVFVGGKMYDRNLLSFSEEDNTVRLYNPYNGLPYTVRENFIPIRYLTGVDTFPLYRANKATNDSISSLFNIAYPEPTLNTFNIIGASHFLFSPTVSKIINDMITGVIASSLYSTPYNDNTIIGMLGGDYKDLLKLDPIKLTFPSSIVVIHPHLGNTVIGLNLLQYRFLQNVIRIVTNNQSEKINLSGYITLLS